MRPTPVLARLERTAVQRALLLRTLADSCGSPPVAAETDRLVSFLAIETLNLWACFARSYYLSCVMGARTRAGASVTISNASVRSFDDAIKLAVWTFNTRLRGTPGPFRPRDEPAWHDTAVLLRLISVVGASTVAQTTTALGHSTTVFRDLPVFRNFFAHRSEGTAVKAANVARSYSLNPALRPSEVLCATRAGRPQSVLSDWIDDVRIVVSGLC